VITIGQGSGHYCAPNAVYDEIARVTPSKCSRRDLVADLHEELDPLGIRLLVYTAAELSWADEKARVGLGLKHHHNDPGSGGVKIWRKHRQVEFMRNIERIMRAWSSQWGRKVAGWWVDGCYLSDVRFPEDDPPNFVTLGKALRAGNPDAIVAFNTGVHVPVIVSTKHDDYTAGELSKKFPEEIPGAWLVKDGKKVRYHTLSYLGTTWGQGDQPRFGDAFVVKFTKQVTEKGGFATWDVPPLKNGCIADSFMKQLAAIGDAMK
jgi:hypothetical protein